MIPGVSGRLWVVDPHRRRPADRVAFCLEVAGIRSPDLGTLDDLARLALVARRSGRRLVLRDASPALRDLLALSGLDAVIACEPCSAGGPGVGVDPVRQPEHREEARRIQEERDPADLPP
jgi:STAS domain